jgi:hypothetical protein
MESDLPLVVDTPGGASLTFKGLWLYSSKEPCALPERSALSFSPPERSLVLVFSPLLGYGLDILMSRLSPGSALLCVEAEPQLYRLAQERIPESLRRDPRVFTALARSPADLAAFLPRLGEFRRVLPLSLSGGYRLHQGSYQAILAALERQIGNLWRNRATLSKLGRLWVRNLIANLSALPRTRAWEELDESVSTKPILVAGAGPSLERIYPWLSRMRSSVFVLAVDTALPALRTAGIRPDAVLCLEGQVYNLRDFIGSSDSGIPLIADLSAQPVSFRGMGGPVYCLASRFADCALLDRLGDSGFLPVSLPPLGSVGVAALSLALRRWGTRSEILVSGLDFAYERGKVHARGAPSHSDYLRTRSRLAADPLLEAAFRAGVRPLGLDGRMVTDPVLWAYAEIAKDELREFPSRVGDLRSYGIDLGIEALGVDAIETIRSAPPPESSDIPAPPPSAAHQPLWRDTRRLAAFARQELDRSRELRSMLAGETRMDRRRFGTLLSECDYLSLHFPDQPARPQLDESFLKRLSVEADSSMRRWESLAVVLERFSA